MSLGPTRANVAETHQGGIGSLPQGAPRALRRRERRCYPPAAFTSAAHAFSPASPYGLLLDGAGSTHKAWLAQTRPVAVVGDTLVLAVPDEFVKEWVEQRYAPTVLAALARTAGRPLNIRVTVREVEDVGEDEHRPPASTQHVSDRPQLTPKYTFERFVIGSSNRFAHAAAVAVAEAPAKSYNPLF